MAAPIQRRNLAGEAILLTLICLFCIFPFYWMVTTSLKSQVVVHADVGELLGGLV